MFRGLREDTRDGGETLDCEPREEGQDLAAELGCVVSQLVQMREKKQRSKL